MLDSVLIATLVTAIFIAALLLGMGILILTGKGDMLIAGYNTASKAEREKYDIKRLRLVIGLLLIILAPCSFLIVAEARWAAYSFSAITIVLTIVALVLANTWAKKGR